MRTAPFLVLALAVVLLAPGAGAALVGGSIEPLFAPHAGLARAPSGYDPLAQAGAHLSINFFGDAGAQRPIAAVLDEHGDVALRITLLGTGLFAAPPVGPRDAVRVSNIVSGWHRLDVELVGDTATVTLDHASSAQVSLAAPLTAGRIVATGGDLARYALARNDRASAVADQVFTSMDPAHGWAAVDPDARLRLEPTTVGGGYSVGSLVVGNTLAPHSRAFLVAPLDGLGGTYVAEAGARAAGTSLPDAAILAGIAGTLAAPTVVWEVRMALDVTGDPDAPYTWRLLYVGPDGAAEFISPPRGPHQLAHLRAIVDEDAGRLAFVVNEGPLAYVATPSGGVPRSDWIAVGDVHGLEVKETPRGPLTLDDLLVLDV